jgi:hypothetical protein
MPLIVHIDYSVTGADSFPEQTLRIDPGLSDRTISLPAADVSSIGFCVVIRKETLSAGNVIISAASGDDIDGSTTKTLTVRFETAFLVISDANQWSVV